MKNVELNRQLQRLDDLFRDVGSATDNNLRLQAHWGRYICVLVAGFLENAISELYGDYTRASASEPVANYATRVLERIQNPKANRFVEVATQFRPRWGDELAAFMQENGRKDAIDSIMTNRHRIAHGQDSGITLARVRAYMGRSVEVLEFIEGQCGA